MSECPYYEFQAIDRPPSAADQRELRAISTRAEITSGRFSNHYEWGDLEGDPEEMLLRWFDAFLYVSNFGSYPLSFRVPRIRARPRTRPTSSGRRQPLPRPSG